ncbi:MAG: flagellar hook-associated protein FlgK [Acidobacteriota bacterium]|nr:flagellar hook-associated protein FlgK [Acidobacteriota bacterium]
MAGLLDILSTTARSLDAQTYGLNTVSQNISNANTPGYSRREVQLAAAAPAGPLSAGGGVDIVGVKADHDPMLDQQLWQEQPLQQQQNALANQLGVVQVAIGTPGQSIDNNLTQFFDAFSTLAQDPISSTNRQQAVLQGQALAQAFNQMSAKLAQAQSSADAGVRSGVDQINALTSQIAQLNGQIANAGGSTTAGGQTLQDQQRVLVGQLADLTGVNVINRSDGGVDISFGTGQALVIGANAYGVSTSPMAGTGFASILASDGTDVTASITGGQIGGLLQARDTNIPGYVSQLDTLAYTVVQQVNTLHAAGYDLNGTTGTNFFTPLASSSGAAAAIAVNPAVVADPSKVAAGSTNSAGDNQTATAISALRDAKVLGGGSSTMSDAWASLVYQVGQDTQTAQNEQQTHASVVQQLQTLQSSVSGVSLDQEAMSMMQFQRAYQASAQLFSLVNQTVDTLLNMVK